MSAARMDTQLVIALDESDPGRALGILRCTAPHADWYKVGYEAYFRYGEQICAALRDAGKLLFLDLKLHDIPNTVAAGVRAAAAAGAQLLTVHAEGGAAMLRAAVEARDAEGAGLRLLAVTVLTSMTAETLRETGVDRAPGDLVTLRARLALRCGVDGAVCAVAEADAVRAATSDDFLVLCPGIRPSGAEAQDQRRVATPAEARRAGANFIVVGRPITRAADPATAAEAIVREMRSELV